MSKLGILTKLLEKRGIKEKDLSLEERATFDNYRAILSKDELTIEDIKMFLEQQVGFIEGRWEDLTTSKERKAELIPYHTVYRIILKAIDSPKLEREALEKVLTQQINQ